MYNCVACLPKPPEAEKISGEKKTYNSTSIEDLRLYRLASLRPHGNGCREVVYLRSHYTLCDMLTSVGLGTRLGSLWLVGSFV